MAKSPNLVNSNRILGMTTLLWSYYEIVLNMKKIYFRFGGLYNVKHKVHFKDGSHEVYNFTYFFYGWRGFRVRRRNTTYIYVYLAINQAECEAACLVQRYIFCNLQCVCSYCSCFALYVTYILAGISFF